MFALYKFNRKISFCLKISLKISRLLCDTKQAWVTVTRAGSEVTRHLLHFSRQWDQPTLNSRADQMSFILLSSGFILQQSIKDGHDVHPVSCLSVSSLISGG